jgi:predicted nucleic acid-binding protein
MTIDELCERHRKVALDANVFVYLLESSGTLADRAAAVVNAISSRRIAGIASTVVLAEVVVGPVLAGDEATAERYVDALRSIDNLHLVPVTVEIGAEAAFARGRRGLGLADAIHVATARIAGASILVTNDRRIRPSSRLEVLQLDDLEA